MHDARRPRGFTLVELLVVIAIIGVLVSLLLPAVQAAREAARMMQCKNNLKQLALAIHTYENSLKVYPAAAIVQNSTDLRSGQMYSWMVMILPQIEQQTLYDQFDFKTTVLQQANDPQATFIAPYVCPSDGAKGKYLVDSALTSGKRFAKGNYAAYCSPFHTDLMDEFPGALIAGRGQEPRDIRDGLTNTVVCSEVRVRANEQDQRGVWALPWSGASLLAFDMHHGGSTGSNFTYLSASLTQTQPPNNQGPNADMLYSCTDLAGAQLAKMPCNTYGDGAMRYLSAAPRSNHPGGVHIALMDGSVRFANDQVDEITMAYLISINDGHVVELDKVLR